MDKLKCKVDKYGGEYFSDYDPYKPCKYEYKKYNEYLPSIPKKKTRQQEIAEAKQEAFLRGQRDGYDRGYREANVDIDAARNQAHQDGFEEGLDAGIKEGRAQVMQELEEAEKKRKEEERQERQRKKEELAAQSSPAIADLEL